MRLLDVTSRRLTEFFDTDVPKYAILSHTWEKEEVSFHDMQVIAEAKDEQDVANVKNKQGYAKVRSACRLAKSHGFRYIWIDTCCIDKSSSAELTEAINSMYRWYKQSEVCYAFISDVETDDPADSPIEESYYLPYMRLPEDLRRSRWFTRGWTLQELLAPTNVQFYCSEWRHIGNLKNSELCSLVSEITMIDESVLKGHQDIHDLSIARRMFWASKRETTRVEDLAYSLLGIFDINMPLIYGEGHKAFRRLQEEILKTSDDHSIFAWHRGSREGAPVDILALSPSYFEDSGSISPHPPIRPSRKPITITNQGIVLELPILSIPTPLHSDYSPFQEIEAILDCQYGSAPGTFPTIRLRSVDGQAMNGYKHYYRVMSGEGMAKIENHNVYDLVSADTVGFDPTQLDQERYKQVLDKLNWDWKVETIVVTRRIPKTAGGNGTGSVPVPWSLSLLRDEYPPDDTPFWLVYFNSNTRGILLDETYSKENWDETLCQMRVSAIPKGAIERGQMCQVVGIFQIRVTRIGMMMPEDDTADTRQRRGLDVVTASLVVGRRSSSRRDSHIKPWCRIVVPPVKESQRSALFHGEDAAGDAKDWDKYNTDKVYLQARVRPVNVSGQFYYMITVKAKSDDGEDDGLRAVNGTQVRRLAHQLRFGLQQEWE